MASPASARWPWPKVPGYLLFVLALLLLFGISASWIPHLGMEYDEAHFYPTAIKIAKGAEERLNPPHGITLAHRPIPFLTMPYVGTLDAFVYAAAYRVAGYGAEVPRYTNTALAALLFCLIWLLVQRLAPGTSGLWGGVFALGLLLVDVELMLHWPTNYGPLLLQQLFLVAALLGLEAWWRNARPLGFLLAIFFLALAFHEKLTFFWTLTSLMAAAAFTFRRETFAVRHVRLYGLGLLLALLVLSPILYYTWQLPEIVLGYGQKNSGLRYEFSLLVSERFKALDLMLRGSWMLNFTAGPVPESLARGPALMLLFALSFFVRHRFAQLCSLGALGIFLWNFAFPDAGRMHHLLLMAPLWQIALGVGFALARPAWRAALLLLLLWAGFDATRAYAWYAPRTAASGGANHWTNNTREAAEWLRENSDLHPVTLNWGLARPLFALSGGEVEVEERYFETLGEFSPETEKYLTQLLERRRTVWLVSDVLPLYGQQWERLLRLATSLQKTPRPVAHFPSPDDRYHLRAYRFDEAEPEAFSFQELSVVSGQEFPVPPLPGFVRLTVRGEASAEPNFLALDWLNEQGQTLFTDHRPLYWYPILNNQSSAKPRTFDLAADLWPAKFSRTLHLAGKPHLASTAERVRISYNLGAASLALQVAQAQTSGTFRIPLQRPLAELRKIADAATPPAQPAGLRKADLVDLTTLSPSIRLDIRYATDNNFMGAALYSRAAAYLQRPAAEALLRVHRALAAKGYGLLIHDAYRPWRVTKMFWDATPPNLRNFVANPAKGSKHNRGCAVDLTLYDLASGKAVEMPSGFDEFTERAYPTYTGGSPAQRARRDLLRSAMEAEGFRVNDDEWWHFDYQDWEKYPILNLSFEELSGR